MSSRKSLTVRDLPPKPPSYLSAEAQAWWISVVTAYEHDDTDLRILEAACQAWDRMTQARLTIAKQGLIYSDARGIQRMRPEVVIEKDARAAFAKLVKQLGYVSPVPAEAPARRKAQTYWSRWKREQHGGP